MHPKHLAAAMLAAVVLSPALATPTASASLDMSSLRFTVEDTDATDGLDASYRQDWMQRNVISCLGPGSRNGCPDGVHEATTWDVRDTASMSGAVPGFAGGAIASPDRLAAEVSGSGDTGRIGINATEWLALTFTGAGRFTATVDYTVSASGLDGLTWRETLAFAGLVVQPWMTPSTFQVDAIAVAPGIGSDTKTGTLELGFAFTDGWSAFLMPHVHVHTLGTSIAAPVPEPGTLSLALAGLGLVGAATARRRAQG